MKQFFSALLIASALAGPCPVPAGQAPVADPATSRPAVAADESVVLDDAVRERLGVKSVRLRDGTTRYEVGGASRDELVVLVHGYSVPSFVWEPVVARLHEAGVATLTYDLFGHGLSDRPATDYTRELYARQLADLLESVRPTGRVHLVGWSMGAMIAARYAIERPERIASVTLVSPSGLGIRMGLMGRVALVPVVGDLGHEMLGGYGLRAAQREFFADASGFDGYMERFEPQMQYRGFRRAMLSTLRHMGMDDFASEYTRYGRLGLPTRVLWGTRDRATPYESSSAFTRLVPGAELLALQDAGHASLYERPDVVAREIVSQVRRAGLRGTATRIGMAGT
jgi:pimeloyl-ACP methyl ester carboxylesterase